VRLQHRSVSHDKFVDRAVVVWPRFQVQAQVRGVGLQEQRFFRDPGPATFRFGRHHDAGRGAAHFVVGHDMRLIGLAARQVLRTNYTINHFYPVLYRCAVDKLFEIVRGISRRSENRDEHTHVQIVRRRVSRDRHLSVRAPGVQVVRHGVAGDRSIAVGRQPPVEHESGTGRTSGVQDWRFWGHCRETIL